MSSQYFLKLTGEMKNDTKFNTSNNTFQSIVVAPIELEALVAAFGLIGATWTFDDATKTFTIDYSTITSFAGLQALLNGIHCTAQIVNGVITVTNDAQAEAVTQMGLLASDGGAKASILYQTTSPLQADYLAKYNDTNLPTETYTNQPSYFGYSDGTEYPNLLNYGYEIADPADNCSVYRIFKRDTYYVPILVRVDTVDNKNYLYAMDVFGTVHKFKSRFE